MMEEGPLFRPLPDGAHGTNLTPDQRMPAKNRVHCWLSGSDKLMRSEICLVCRYQPVSIITNISHGNSQLGQLSTLSRP